MKANQGPLLPATPRELPATGPGEEAAEASGTPTPRGSAGTAVPQSPAGGAPSVPSASPAGSRGLRGAEWRKEAARASRRRPAKTTPSAAAKTAPLPPVTGGAVLTATARCLGRCDWTAGPGDPAGVDKAAEKHVKAGHPVNVVAEVAEIGGAT